ncbi:(2,3-dihydroxybenzoyl)adenylate synthase [Mycobacterium sp.]|uniref:(2,3-dihydroxybenzoyl)adenylate synthase n=1 Tax=Mycobacterium sp. TaxID=1785 RepID=UPI002D967D57|nr:AMP-binding protein [Mycobacterium sp.]
MTDSTFTEDDIVAYPRDFIDRYRSAGAWRDLTIAQEFRAVADRYPDRPAVVGPDLELSYAELDRRADRIAVGLRKEGVRPGDPVLLQLTNQAATVLIWYGLLKAGAIPVATLALHRRHEITAIARQCAPVVHVIDPAFPGHDLRELAAEVRAEQPSVRLLVTVGNGAPEAGETSLDSLLAADIDPVAARAIVDEIQAGISAESIGVLQLSGGTTSIPKLIPRLHTEYWYNSRAWAEAVRIDSGSCTAHLLPIVHNAGVVCAMHAAHAVGACVATCMPDAAQFKAVAVSHPITHMLATRPIMGLIDSDPELRAALDALRVVVWSDRAVPPAVVDEFETDTCRVTQMFGMGEGLCMVTSVDLSTDLRHHTQGAPIAQCDEVRVLKPGTEDPVQFGEHGELCARGPYTIRGYFRAPERNAAAFTSDGFYRTGDIVVEMRDGGQSYYRLEDRIKDLINRGGEKINAEEVETVLIDHPAVERVAVVAMPDERLGERSCAFLVVREGVQAPDLAAIKQYFEERGVAKYKWPERVEHRKSLPLTNIHKINKATLRREIAEILQAEGAARKAVPSS